MIFGTFVQSYKENFNICKIKSMGYSVLNKLTKTKRDVLSHILASATTHMLAEDIMAAEVQYCSNLYSTTVPLSHQRKDTIDNELQVVFDVRSHGIAYFLETRKLIYSLTV